MVSGKINLLKTENHEEYFCFKKRKIDDFFLPSETLFSRSFSRLVVRPCCVRSRTGAHAAVMQIRNSSTLWTETHGKDVS